MTAELLHGKPISERIRKEATGIMEGFQAKVVAIHNPRNSAARVYMHMQKKMCARAGIGYEVREVNDGTRLDELVGMIQGLNLDSSVTGITVHLPLPEPIETNPVLFAISPDKDIEGTHPHNLGLLAYADHNPCPNAARAAVEMLSSVEPSFKGLEAVIIGHSEMVGKAISYLLLQSKRESATPTICHIATKDLRFYTKRADVLFVAAGKAGLIRGDMIKPGATVIDIGINEGPDNTIVGDVVMEEALEVAGRITPVPGGVGPVTLAVLQRNIAVCARRLMS